MDIADPRDKMPAPVAEPVETDLAQPQGDPSLAADLRRRRLLRGLAALPAVYTLGSGAQVANLSSHQCVGLPDGQSDPAAQGVLHDPTDICASGFQRGAPGADYANHSFAVTVGVNESNNVPPQGAGVYYLFSYDQDLKFVDQYGGSWTRQSAQNTNFLYNGTNPPRGGTQIGLFPAVYVNNQGALAFFPDRNASMVGISCSCWSSFAPVDGNPLGYKGLGF